VQENVEWFSNEGGPTASVEIRVLAAGAPEKGP
jgi:hypothetical protein